MGEVMSAGGRAVPVSEPLQALIDHPDALERELCERSLHYFIKSAWGAMDPEPYIDNWHIEHMAEHLEAVADGEIRRLLINIPPRSMKSLSMVAFGAWLWAQKRVEGKPLRGPQVKIMGASYHDDLSIRDNVKTRSLIQTEWYQRLWGGRFDLKYDQNEKTKFENTKGGVRMSISMKGKVTGEGGNILIIDDPHNVQEAESEVKRQLAMDWLRGAMSTRSNNPKSGARIMVMQRVHHHDVAGYVIERGWEHLCIPARYEANHPHIYDRDPRTKDGELMWPERYDNDDLAEIEEELGSYKAAGQLQQRPAPRDGGMFKADWFGIVSAAPAGGAVVRGWDLAASTGLSSPYTAGIKIRLVDGEYYIEDVVRGRMSAGDVERTLLNTAARDTDRTIQDIPQDPGQAGKAQVKWLVKKLAGYIVRFSPESGDKVTRAEALAAQAEAGNVYLVRAPWNEEFLMEATLFPNSDYMDQIDAASRAFHQLTARSKRRTGVQGPRLIVNNDLA